ncbi:MAG: hypothetical protein WEC59_00555, partial [Salibacteraceae bacterium]
FIGLEDQSNALQLNIKGLPVRLSETLPGLEVLNSCFVEGLRVDRSTSENDTTRKDMWCE